MSQKEVLYLVGDFGPATLERWERWAELTNRDIKRISMKELGPLHGSRPDPVLIMDDYGLNDAPLPVLEQGTRVHEEVDMHLVIYDEVTSINVQKLIKYLDKPMPLDHPRPRNRRTKGERKGGKATRW